MKKIVVGIDASRNRSGGAKGHLVGILTDSDPTDFGIRRVHLWSYSKLLAALPDRPWLIKHNPMSLERSLASQIWWQFSDLPGEIRSHGCDVMLNTDAGSVCPFAPAVVMSRDMLSYEPGEMQRFGWGKARARLIALRYVQNRSLRTAQGAIFLTEYAAKMIQGSTGRLPNVRIVPHGVSETFRNPAARRPWPKNAAAIRCLYVSNASMYKHQWHVVRAIAELRRRGTNLMLHLVGGGEGPALRLLNEAIAECDPNGEFVTCEGFVPPSGLPAVLADADLFVFASSCENMPNTLVEAMASGLPIACSNRGPMPEILRDAGVFFDPENYQSIAESVERLIRDDELRAKCAARAHSLSTQYSWSRCGQETWQFLLDTYARYSKCL